jgi:hypothetical protein
MNRQILSGWKEICNYIRRGVRTAQRWEIRLGMPVHRPALKDRSAVVAFTDELDRWLSRTAPDTRETEGELSGEALIRLHHNLGNLYRHSSLLASQTKALQKQLRRSLQIHDSGLASRMCAPTSVVSNTNSSGTLTFPAKNDPPTPPLIPGREAYNRLPD